MMREKIDFVLKWVACFVTLTGAICTALQVTPVNVYLLNLGALLYLIWSIRIREWNLITINTALVTIYAVGVIVDLVK